MPLRLESNSFINKQLTNHSETGLEEWKNIFDVRLKNKPE